MGAACTNPARLSEAPLNELELLSVYDSGPYFVYKPDAEAKIRYAKTGPASSKENPAKTLMQWMREAVNKHPSAPALKVERPCPPLVNGVPPPALPEDQWMTWSYTEYLADVEAVAKGFIKLGMLRHDAVNVWGFNSPEWVIAAHAACWAGGKVAGLYPTDTDDTAAYKVAHSGGSIVVVEERSKITKLQAGLKTRGIGAKRIKAIVAYGFEPQSGETIDVPGAGKVPIYAWKDVVAQGKSESDQEMQKRHADTRPGHCAGIIYTSGTTGDPKAVMISHDNIAFEAGCLYKTLKETVGYGQTEPERLLSYLPLSHVAGMMLDIISPVTGSALGQTPVSLYFARNYDLKVGAIKDRLQIARPTFFMGVPLVWEKIADKIRAIGAANTGVKKAMGDWAKGAALQNSKSKQLGLEIAEPMGLTVALKLLGKVKENLGLDVCKYCLTGAAPMRVDTVEYYGSLGMTINEVYGMSECTGAATISTPAAHQWGSCGYELPGVEVRAFKVDEVNFTKKTLVPKANSLDDAREEVQGELCYRGRNIMMGYMCQPDFGSDHVKEIEKKNQDTIDQEGWLHSGDKGMITILGMCKITGRYKELIIGEGGENIAPVPIEDHVKRMCDGVAEIMMVGDKRKYNVALVTLKAVGANGEVPGTDDLDAGAARLNPACKTISGAMKDKMWIDTVTAAIKSANDNGKVCFNNAAKIQKFTILPTNFSEQGGELTPTKKLKRAVVHKMYDGTIEKIYKTEGMYIPYE
jgi:long-chain-fatty-acid--CoA ligase ACSBG